MDYILSYIASWVVAALQQITGGITSGISNVNAWVSSIFSTVTGAIGNVFAQIGDSVGSLVNAIRDTLSGLLGNIGPTISGIVESVASALGNVFGPLFARIEELVGGIHDALAGLLSGIREGLNTLWTTLQSVISETFSQVAQLAQDSLATLQAAISDMVTNVTGWIRSVFDALRSLIISALNSISSVAQSIAQGVLQALQAPIAAIQQSINQTAQLIQAEWKTLVEGPKAIIATIEERISDFRSAVDEAIPKLVDSIGELGTKELGPIRKSIDEIVAGFAGFLSNEDRQRIGQAVDTALSPNTLALESRAGAYTLFNRLLPSSAFGKVIFYVVMAPLLLYGVYSGVVQANAKVILQEFSAHYPHELIPVPDVIAALNRGLYDEAQATQVMQRHGLSTNHIATMLKSRFAPLGPETATAYWKRGLLTEEQLNAQLKANGFEPATAQAIKTAADLIPPVQDIITMAVREAFSPETAQAFGQFEDFPAAFAEWSAKQGLTREWAERYWAAHWSLPSISQGFEMLHREAVTPEMLDLLLKAQDVMPAWRAPLKAIAYAPLTRVDVRRMHKVGVLTDGDVELAYRHLGYSPEDAIRLRDFVVQINKGPTLEEAPELGKLTRATVLNFYADGLIDRNRAIAMLKELGLTLDAATLYVTSVDLENKRSERKAEADHIVELAISGSISFEVAQDRLNALGLETIEVDRALAKLLRAREKTIKLPSRAEGEKMLQAGVLDEAGYTELLGRLGYAPQWVRAFVALAKVKADASRES